MVRISAERLQNIVTEVFKAVGVPTSSAQIVAEDLVESNLVGHDSHGVFRVDNYADSIERGIVDPRAEPRLIQETPAAALLDGARGFGQIAGRKAMDIAMGKAQSQGIGATAVRECSHTGRMGAYAVRAAEHGFMGMVLGGGPYLGGIVAPFLGASRVLDTNPMAWAIPAANRPPVFLDFATSICAWGKVQVAIDKRERIPEGWILDADGNPSTDPQDLSRGGALLPFGEHKGYALSFFIEVLTRGLTGLTKDRLPKSWPCTSFTMVMVAVNVGAFGPLETFTRIVDEVIEAVKAARKAPGVGEILIPGEPEWRTRQLRLREGIELPEATWQRIVETGARYGYVVPAMG